MALLHQVHQQQVLMGQVLYFLQLPLLAVERAGDMEIPLELLVEPEDLVVAVDSVNLFLEV